MNELDDYPQVTRDDVVEAAERIAGEVERTPLIAADCSGRRLWLKCESLQTGGSFKLRGATNRLLQLSRDQRDRGVVAFSSGNHAQGVAIAARRLGIRATIVMPSDAPAPKIAGTRSQGAEIVLYDRRSEDRIAIANAIATERGATVVPSFDDPHIVAGQGTVGLEIAEQLEEQGLNPTRIVVNCGGGGLSAGIALALPDAEIVPVEPQGWDDMRLSLENGAIQPASADAPPTICDAIQTPLVSPITFGILHRRGAKGVAVSEDEVKAAIRWVWEAHGLTVEPGGAASLAAVLAGKAEIIGETVVVLSGGNIEPDLHRMLIG
jgi:threonine dehydratase